MEDFRFWTSLGVAFLVALILIYQDIRTRYVYAPLIILIAVMGIVFPHTYWSIFFQQSLANILIISIILLILWLYYRIKGENFVNEKLGLGDILAFYGFATWFEAEAYLVFFIVSMLSALLGTGILHLLKRLPENPTVPLVAYMSGVFILFRTLLFFL